MQPDLIPRRVVLGVGLFLAVVCLSVVGAAWLMIPPPANLMWFMGGIALGAAGLGGMVQIVEDRK